jgi:hypothetical protein
MGVPDAILGPMSVTCGGGTSADQDEGPGLWTSFGTTLRLIVGWFSVVIGALNLIVEIDRPSGASDGPYLTFNGVWLTGGLVLLALAWIDPRPRIVGYVAGGVVALAGMIISAMPATTTICCVSEYAVRHGYPFTFVARNDGVGATGRWHVDGPHAVADLMFWVFLGLMVLVLVSLVPRAPEPTAHPPEPIPNAPEPIPADERQFIEHREHAEERAPQNSVGPLP